MPTPVFACGAECGVAGHLIALNNASFSTSVFRSGLRSIRVNPSAASTGQFTVPTGIITGTTIVVRFYVRFDTLPSVNARIFTVGATPRGCYFNQSDSKLYAGANFGVLGASGVAVTTGVQYRIDVSIVNTGGVTTVQVSVDGTAATNATVSVSESYSDDALWGSIPASGNITSDLYFDDILVSRTSGDYPIGAGYVLSYIPNADGTHNVAGTNDFERTLTGTDITNATTDAYELINDRPLPTTAVDFINGIAPPNATDYVEWQYEDSVESVAPRAVEAVIVHHDASGSGTNNFTVTLREHAGGTSANIHSGTTNVGATITYKRAHFATVPGTSDPWTTTKFNALRSRFLVSDSSPDPYIDAAMLEAEFPASSNQTISPTAVAIPIVTAAPTVTKTLAISPSAIAIPVVTAAPTITKTLVISPTAVAIPIVIAAPNITRDQTISPSAVAIPVVTAAPTITKTLTISPSAVATPIVTAAPTLTHTLTISPSAVAITLVVAAPTISVTQTISPTPVAIPVVTAAPTITVHRLVSPTSVTIPIVTAAPAITHTLTINPTAVAIPVVTAAPTVTVHRLVSPSPVAIPIVMAAPVVTKTLTITPTAIAIPIVTAAPTITLGAITISPSPVAISLSVQAPTVTKTLTISPSAVAVSIVTVTPTVSKTLTISPSSLATPIVTAAPSITHTLTISPIAVTIPLVVPSPSVSVGGVITISPTPVAIPVVTAAPTVTKTLTISPSVVAIPLVVAAPALSHVLTISPTAVTIPLVVPAPTVTTGSGTQTITPSAVAIPLVVIAPSIVHALTITPTPIAVQITVPAPVVLSTLTITPAAVAIPIVLTVAAINHPVTITPSAVAVLLVIPQPTVSGGSTSQVITPIPLAITLVVATVAILHGPGAIFVGQVELEDLIDQNTWPDNVEFSEYTAPIIETVPSGFMKDPTGTHLWDMI